MAKVLKNRIISLYKEGKTYNEISKILRCSKGTISYHCSNTIDRSRYSSESIEKYQELYNNGTTLTKISEDFKISRQFLSRKLTHIKNSIVDIDKNYNKRKAEYRKNIKKQCIEYKGGKCILCNYNKCIRALEFHHLNPLEKDYVISGGTKSFNSLKKELDKCILVCSNCHKEIHDGLYSDIYPRTDTA